MQQVGAKSFVGAQAVDPRQFPAILPRSSRRVLVVVTHAWVLHRQRIVRIIGGLVVLLALLGVFQARDALGTAGVTLYRMVQGEFAQAGFGIDAIQITGQVLTDDRDVINLLTIGAGNSTLTFDAQQAQARLHWLRAVQSATVRKVYPNQVIVDIVEKTPLVRWRVGDTTWLIDERGHKIGKDAGYYTDLPLVIGEGAADDAIPMVRVLQRHVVVGEGLAALSRIGDRRWDLIYRNGLRVQLPETGVAQALAQLERYQRDHALLDRDVTQIDLRVEGFVALRPGEIAAAEITAARKPQKGKRQATPQAARPPAATTQAAAGSGAQPAARQAPAPQIQVRSGTSKP